MKNDGKNMEHLDGLDGVSPILVGGWKWIMTWIMTFPSCWECHHHWTIISTWRIFQASFDSLFG